VLSVEEYKKDELPKLLNTVLKLLADVYVDTRGGYPRMEWLKPEEKPKIGDPNFFEQFKEKYGTFLRWRLTHELDELYILKCDGDIIGCIALNYDLRGKNISWIPEDYLKRYDVGFIELFVVSPKERGKGFGKKLFSLAINRLRELNKRPMVVTFPDLEAMNFYKSMGGKVVKKYDVFVLIEF